MPAVTQVAAMSGVPFIQQNAQSTGNGTSLALPPSFRNHTWIITAAAGVTSGAVQIEASNNTPLASPNTVGDPAADTGTWAAIGTPTGPTTVTAGADLMVTFTGLLNIVRARISTTIAGGAAPSVTVTYVGAKSY
jgi:hypothetical protein